MMESNHLLAIIDRGLDLRANPAWCAGLALVAGGLPVLADGDVAGAIGVAGAMTAAEDRAITEAALEAALAGMAR